MANKWTIKALELEEQISKLHCFPNFMYWDTKKAKFYYRKKGDKHFYVAHIPLIIGIIEVLVASTALIWNLKMTQSTHNDQQFLLLICGVWLFFMLLSCLGCGMNLIFMQGSDEFVGCLNLLIEYGKEIEVVQRKSYQKPRKISVEDIVGLFAISSVCFLHVAPFILIIFRLITYPAVDASHWILQQVIGINYAHDLSFYFRYPLLSIRFLYNYIFCSEVLHTVSNMCNIIFLESPIFLKCLNHYKQQQLSYHLLSEYDKLFRIRQINIKECAELTGRALGVCFAMMILSGTLCIFGWTSFDPAILSCFIGASFIQLGATHSTLPLIAMLYDLSSEIIENWRAHVDKLNISKRKDIGKILYHTRPISFACGSLGHIRKETKRNYFGALLDKFISVTVTFKEFL